ncbi:MAG: lipid A biosynthesis lauroyl acyltransferase [Xanthomonadales bacterium]|nr:lipid A biosynthesis lauroyl acyltransferase [Gammaproteobacteria bacterium]MBT8053128.1 lipid A biosynthesis lauroyl acyltransferase [Gammaproteobacteria bacterium]NND56220.1 lipid A biosynthesis lauroyl acyltransferase [Xanthomonadales bacterium]NNK52295.1 lipid A biosynthesis lauroyl acyltransferase [Xanthomonadales bacterium]
MNGRQRFLQSVFNLRDWLVAQTLFLSLKALRMVPMDTSIRLFERMARWLGPKLGRHRVAMDNLAIAFPEKSTAEREKIALDSWAQMARGIAEYGYLDQVFDLDENNLDAGRIEVKGVENFLKLRDDDLPAIIFTGHLGNFELLPMAAAKFGLEIQSLFRAPNNKYAAARIAAARKQVSGNLVASGRGASFQLMRALEKGDHVGVLVDQKFRRGIEVSFFGQSAPTNTLLAKLARRYNCPVHGARSIRLPNGRFRLEVTDELSLPRTGEGDIDIRGTTELITRVVEGWVREYPEQWLWIHRRWG